MDVKRELILNLHVRGKTTSEIMQELKGENINRRFVQRTVARYKKTGSVAIQKKSGRKRSVRTKKNIKIVRERVRRNPAVSTRKLGKSLGMSHQSAHLILKKDLGLKAFKKRRIHGLTTQQIEKRKKDARSYFAGMLLAKYFSRMKSCFHCSSHTTPKMIEFMLQVWRIFLEID